MGLSDYKENPYNRGGIMSEEKEVARHLVETFMWVGDKDNLPHLIEDIASAIKAEGDKRCKELYDSVCDSCQGYLDEKFGKRKP
mgnify:CR=1 FL=1